MFKKEYLLEAQKGKWDLEKIWERCVNTKEKNGSTLPFALESSYNADEKLVIEAIRKIINEDPLFEEILEKDCPHWLKKVKGR